MTQPSPIGPPPSGRIPDQGTRPPGSAPSPSAPAPVPGPADDGGNLLERAIPGYRDLTETIGAARAWMGNRHNWVRVAWFASGGVLFVVGAVMLTGRPAMQAVNTVKGVVKP